MDSIFKSFIIIGVLFSMAFLANAINTSDATYQSNHGKIVNTTSDTQYTKGRAYGGTGGTQDTLYNQRSNMSQSGIHDARIPLNTRQNYATAHNLQLPSR